MLKCNQLLQFYFPADVMLRCYGCRYKKDIMSKEFACDTVSYGRDLKKRAFDSIPTYCHCTPHNFICKYLLH